MSKEKISRAEMKRLRDLPNETKSHKEPSEQFVLESIPELKDNLPPKEKKRLDTLAIETEKQKKAIVIQLRKTPIVQLACERTGVGRSTYYKWRAGDKIFARVADKALNAGRFFINDLAESKLLGLVKNDNLTAIIFWLKHNHPKYAAVNRIIHQYETVTERPSVEEENIATQEMSKMIALRHTPKFTTEEIQKKIEEEIHEVENNKESTERMKSFEED